MSSSVPQAHWWDTTLDARLAAKLGSLMCGSAGAPILSQNNFMISWSGNKATLNCQILCEFLKVPVPHFWRQFACSSSGFKRLRATAAKGPNYVGPSCGYMLAYVGVWWPILRAARAHLVAMLAYVCLMLAHVEPKDPKNGNSKKTAVKRRIFDGRRPILGLCWPILELCWPILGLCWPILGLFWPIFRPMLAHLEAYVGPCWPILGLCWPILGLCWPILRPMLAHVDPS